MPSTYAHRRFGTNVLEHLPEYYRSLSAEMTVISDNLESLAGHLSPEAGQKIGELTGSLSTQIGTIVGSLGGVTMGVAGNAAGKIPSLLISFLFVLLFAYFFTAQSERVQDFIKIIVPEETRRQLQLIGKKMKFAVGGYFRAQFKIMFIVFVILTAGLLVLRVPYAVLAAAGIAVLDFLPMLGTGTILIPWAVLWALSGKLSSAAGLVILYAVTQVTRQLIQPKMVGDSIGMDAMTTLIFLFIGYRKVVRIDAAGDSRHSQSGGESASAADGDRQDEFAQSGAGLRHASERPAGSGHGCGLHHHRRGLSGSENLQRRAMCV